MRLTRKKGRPNGLPFFVRGRAPFGRQRPGCFTEISAGTSDTACRSIHYRRITTLERALIEQLVLLREGLSRESSAGQLRTARRCYVLSRIRPKTQCVEWPDRPETCDELSAAGL